jgi:hypothetical protein
MAAGQLPGRNGKERAMKSIHIVFGEAERETMVRAHRLAILERDAFVHEIESSEDIRLVMASRYNHCIATLRAASETMARERMSRMVSASQASSCAMTFEPAPLRG